MFPENNKTMIKDIVKKKVVSYTKGKLGLVVIEGIVQVKIEGCSGW